MKPPIEGFDDPEWVEWFEWIMAIVLDPETTYLNVHGHIFRHFSDEFMEDFVKGNTKQKQEWLASAQNLLAILAGLHDLDEDYALRLSRLDLHYEKHGKEGGATPNPNA